MIQKEKEENNYIEDKYIVPYPNEKIDNITILEGGLRGGTKGKRAKGKEGKEGKGNEGKGGKGNEVKTVADNQSWSPRSLNQIRAAEAKRQKAKRDAELKKKINDMEKRLAK